MFENADNDNVEMFGAKVVTVTRWCDAQNLTWYTLPDTYNYITLKLRLTKLKMVQHNRHDTYKNIYVNEGKPHFMF